MEQGQQPLHYAPSERKHVVYSEDTALIGQMLMYSVRATFADFQTGFVSVESNATLELLDPCLDPQQLHSQTVPSQVTSVEYFYTGADPALEYDLQPFVVFPPICTVQYSCRVSSGQRLDLCELNDGLTLSSFD